MAESMQVDGTRDGSTVAPNDGAVDGDFDDEVLPASGTLVGPYRLLAILGSGGMGHVWRAEHVKLGRQVALKMLRRRHVVDSTAVARFFAEARAVNSIRHDNIIEVTDFLELAEGSCYVMELLEGQSLAAAMRAEAFSLQRIVDVVIQVAAGMDAVHAASIVHRDLKPDNIFLVPRAGKEFVKLLDFGVAKLGPKERALETRAGALLGTPEYMAPEQLVGKPVDHRADIYALGIILYELVAGRRPFMGQTFGALVLQHSMVAPPPLPAATDARLADLIGRCLGKDPDLRPASMSAIATELAKLSEVEQPPVLTTPSAAAALSPTRPSRVAVAVVAGIAALAVGALAWGAWPRAEPEASIPIPIQMHEAPALPPPPADGAVRGDVASIAASSIAVPSPPPSPAPPPLARPAQEAQEATDAQTLKTTSRAAARKPIPVSPRVPANAPAEQVIIRLTSTPSGAEVRDARGKFVGKTPLSLTLQRDESDTTFELRSGGLVRTASVRRNVDGGAHVIFEPDGGRSTILSPFSH